MAVRYDNSVARLLAEHDFGPDGATTIRQAALDSGYWESCPAAECVYVGTSAAVRRHRQEADHLEVLTKPLDVAVGDEAAGEAEEAS